MQTILVISNEPALAETLASELPDYTFLHSPAKNAAGFIEKGDVNLILLDDMGEQSASFNTAKAVLVKLSRPIRLLALMETIRSKLSDKALNKKEELAIMPEHFLIPSERVLYAKGSEMRLILTEKEVEILLCLHEQNGQPITRDALLKRVWGYSDDVTTHTLETHLYRLRGKLKQIEKPLDIVLEEGGYRLTATI